MLYAADLIAVQIEQYRADAAGTGIHCHQILVRHS